MAQIKTEDAIRYGGSLLLYLFFVYFVGGIVLFVGLLIFGAGSGGPFSRGNPILLILGFLIGLIGYVIVLAGTLGIGYKVIGDAVAQGVDNSSVAQTILGENTDHATDAASLPQEKESAYELHPTEYESKLSEEEKEALKATIDLMKREGIVLNRELQREIYPRHPCGWESESEWLDKFMKPLLASHPKIESLRKEGDRWTTKD